MDVDEKYNDETSMLLIADTVRRGLLNLPVKPLKKEYNMIYLDATGTKAIQVGLGTNWPNVWRKWNEDKKNLNGVLVYPNGKIYTWNGERNKNGYYPKAMVAISLFF